MKNKLMLSLLLVSCAHIGNATVRSGQEQAAWVIWNKAYQRQDMPPKVRWIEGKDLNCIDGAGVRGFSMPDIDDWQDDKITVVMKCMQGYTWSPLEVLVAWHGTEISFSETSLAHEFLHAYLLRLGVYLGHHELPGFYENVDNANAEVVKSGL